MQSKKDRLVPKASCELPLNELQSAAEMYDQEEIDGLALRKLFIIMSENLGPEHLSAMVRFTDRMKSNERFRHLCIRKLRRSRPELAIKFEELREFYITRISAYQSGAWLGASVRNVAEAAIKNGNSKIPNPYQLNGAKELFSNIFRKIRAGGSTLVMEKQDVLNAIAAAFLIGMAGGQYVNVSHMWNEWNETRTRAARAARRADAVQELIEAEAAVFWTERPSKRTKFSDTARAIWPRLKQKLAESPELSREWLPDAWGGDKQMIERIRKRIMKITKPDERQLSKKNAGRMTVFQVSKPKL